MKRLTVISLLSMLLLWGTTVPADTTSASEGGHQNLESVLSDIRQSQGVDSNDKIDCEKVSNQQFEQVGEALMDVAHPNPKEHALMDRMMGGEGSQSLAQMHRLMGARYLGCYRGGDAGEMGYGMMGGFFGMQGYGPMGHMYDDHGWGMMDSWGGGWLMGLLLIIIIAVIVFFIIQNRRSPRQGGEESPLDVLRKRYARGEITKEQFEQMKKDLGI